MPKASAKFSGLPQANPKRSAGDRGGIPDRSFRLTLLEGLPAVPDKARPARREARSAENRSWIDY
jgi:hypothetical protein